MFLIRVELFSHAVVDLSSICFWDNIVFGSQRVAAIANTVVLERVTLFDGI